MLEASIVIATRNRAALLRGCLARLAGQTAAGRFEVIVVDNASTDETAAMVAEAADGGLAVRRTFVAEPNRAKARNAGIAAATGQTIIFCDDDTLAPAGYVAAHLEARSSNSRAVVSGPIINVEDDSRLARPGARHYSRAFLCTCNAGVSRADLEAVGGFDERYDLYGWEDTDLGIRLRAAGAARIWSWDAYLYHVKPPDLVTLDKRIALAKEKGMMAARFVRKSPTLPVKLATGAYAANFVRAAILGMRPLLRLYERAARTNPARSSVLAAVASDALVDAAYVEALRSGLRLRDA
jgi:glycosyltransferase involved in cell wall biosynthesis